MCQVIVGFYNLQKMVHKKVLMKWQLQLEMSKNRRMQMEMEASPAPKGKPPARPPAKTKLLPRKAFKCVFAHEGGRDGPAWRGPGRGGSCGDPCPPWPWPLCAARLLLQRPIRSHARPHRVQPAPQEPEGLSGWAALSAVKTAGRVGKRPCLRGGLPC